MNTIPAVMKHLGDGGRGKKISQDFIAQKSTNELCQPNLKEMLLKSITEMQCPIE